MHCKACNKETGYVKEELCAECLNVVDTIIGYGSTQDSADIWYAFEDILDIKEDEEYNQDLY